MNIKSIDLNSNKPFDYNIKIKKLNKDMINNEKKKDLEKILGKRKREINGKNKSKNRFKNTSKIHTILQILL